MHYGFCRKHADQTGEGGCPECAMDHQQEEITALRAEVEALKKLRDFFRECPECGAVSPNGPFPPMDEDGCCTLCGTDCLVVAFVAGAKETEAECDHLKERVAELETAVEQLKSGIHPAKKQMEGGFSLDKFMPDVSPEDAAALGDFLDEMQHRRYIDGYMTGREHNYTNNAKLIDHLEEENTRLQAEVAEWREYNPTPAGLLAERKRANDAEADRDSLSEKLGTLSDKLQAAEETGAKATRMMVAAIARKEELEAAIRYHRESLTSGRTVCDQVLWMQIGREPE